LFIEYTVTSSDLYAISSNEIENKRIQILKPTSLNDFASNFGLEQQLLSIDEIDNGVAKRELFQILYSIIGALGLFVGIEPVIHFL
jgi:hypothetical protein